MDPEQTLSEKIHNSRIVILNGEVNSQSAAQIIFEMLSLEKENPNSDIFFYINSPGGSVPDGLAIYDTMQYIKPDVVTVCFGTAASMGSFLLSSGTKGKRAALPHSQILIHQPMVGLNGVQQQTDITILSKHMERTRVTLEKIMARNMNKSVEQIHTDTERDFYMTAEEALDYGLIDKILYPEHQD